MDIHEEMDSTKSALADVRHRAVYHSAFGIYIVQRIFGQTRTNSEGKVYSVRDIAEQHIMEDLGRIPSLQDWMEGAPIEPWMMGKKTSKEVKNIPFDQVIKVPSRTLPYPGPGVTTQEYDGSVREPSPCPQPAIPDADIATTHPDFARTITID